MCLLTITILRIETGIPVKQHGVLTIFPTKKNKDLSFLPVVFKEFLRLFEAIV